MPRIFQLRRVVAAGVALTAGLTAIPAGAGTAAADPLNGNDRNGIYLALGDSVAFGYRPLAATPTPNYYHPRSFVSYANYVAADLGERVDNASCPGETAGSMLNVTAISNGCENTLGAPGGYRTQYPLHVHYSGSQMAYAVKYLSEHLNRTSLVSIDIGANDGFVCQETGACSSAAGLDAALAQITANVHDILAQIRATGYKGPLVLLNYYSTAPYKDPSQAGAVHLTQLLNQALDTGTAGDKRHHRRWLQRLRQSRLHHPHRRPVRRRPADQSARRVQHPPIPEGPPGAGRRHRDRPGQRRLRETGGARRQGHHP